MNARWIFNCSPDLLGVKMEVSDKHKSDNTSDLHDDHLKEEKRKQEKYKKIKHINDNLDPNKKESLYKFPFG